jgi:hypothetical protein
MGPGPGIPSGFIIIFVLFFLFAIGTSIFKFSQTRQMAMKKGATEAEATAIAMSGDVGTAASFVKHPERSTPLDDDASDERPAAARIAEVRSLVQQGLITQEQADTRIAEILRSI